MSRINIKVWNGSSSTIYYIVETIAVMPGIRIRHVDFFPTELPEHDHRHFVSSARAAAAAVGGKEVAPARPDPSGQDRGGIVSL
ncbi:hypothetical protein GWI33_006487 [Rhynchophorus ferrugineus]|uniref:Uncharacterized protein n=1 Tax=Rhynchophorus ferrugineus TaxID=354439 RepID=A0A834IG11_RHYFE|nr:hypothetical protein GWI33_006487 [Rhynchophorus ferrugineus]